MAINLRVLSALGTVGAGAGISAPLTTSYLKEDGDQDISLVSYSNLEGESLSRSKRSLEQDFYKSVAKKVTDLKSYLSETWKKELRRKIRDGSGKLNSFINKKFDKHSSIWKGLKDKVSGSALEVKDKLWGILDFQDSLFKGQNERIFNQFGELETLIKDIKNTQHSIILWQSKWANKDLSPKIQELKRLLSQIQPNEVFSPV